jgi:hypothetical protein
MFHIALVGISCCGSRAKYVVVLAKSKLAQNRRIPQAEKATKRAGDRKLFGLFVILTPMRG